MYLRVRYVYFFLVENEVIIHSLWVFFRGLIKKIKKMEALRRSVPRRSLQLI